jgi:hypothetical protein
MDVKGAKALKKRLERNGARTAPATARARNVAADAPPVYQWTGVSKPRSEAAPESDEPETPDGSLFRRLGLSFR